MIPILLMLMATAPDPARKAALKDLSDRQWAQDLDCAGLAEAQAEAGAYSPALKLAMSHWIAVVTVKASKAEVRPEEIDRRLDEARLAMAAALARGEAGAKLAACTRDLEIAVPSAKP